MDPESWHLCNCYTRLATNPRLALLGSLLHLNLLSYLKASHAHCHLIRARQSGWNSSVSIKVLLCTDATHRNTKKAGLQHEIIPEVIILFGFGDQNGAFQSSRVMCRNQEDVHQTVMPNYNSVRFEQMQKKTKNITAWRRCP